MGNNKSLTSIDENLWDNWSPISHQYVDDLWRVPTHVTNANCTLFVGDKMKRTFEKSLTPEFVKTKQIQQSTIKDYYVTDFSGSHALVNVKKAFFVKSDLISGPMNGKVAGFSTIEGAKALANEKAGVLQKWEEIF
jgi:nitrous oxide reductase accessory protein NosL